MVLVLVGTASAFPFPLIVSGTIHVNDIPVSDIEIKMTSESTNHVATTKTDKDGRYQIDWSIHPHNTWSPDKIRIEVLGQTKSIFIEEGRCYPNINFGVFDENYKPYTCPGSGVKTYDLDTCPAPIGVCLDNGEEVYFATDCESEIITLEEWKEMYKLPWLKGLISAIIVLGGGLLIYYKGRLKKTLNTIYKRWKAGKYTKTGRRRK